MRQIPKLRSLIAEQLVADWVLDFLMSDRVLTNYYENKDLGEIFDGFVAEKKAELLKGPELDKYARRN